MAVLEPQKTSLRIRPTCFGGMLKRGQDILIAAPTLVLLMPIMLLIGMAVWLSDGGPPMFVQRRVGRHGTDFPFFKFRTMVPDAASQLARRLEEDAEAAREWREKQKLTHDPRVTGIGRILRATSLDELPQFANVLLGHMSLVGPRPMLPEQVVAYGSGFPLYCTARPGITGLWQVSGRNGMTFAERSTLDQVYLQVWSPRIDLELLVRTVGVVLRRQGAC